MTEAGKRLKLAHKEVLADTVKARNEVYGKLRELLHDLPAATIGKTGHQDSTLLA